MPAAALPKMVGAEIPRLLPGPQGAMVCWCISAIHTRMRMMPSARCVSEYVERFAENDINMAVLSDLTRPPTSGRGLSKFWPHDCRKDYTKKDRESTSPRAWKPLLKGRDGTMGLKLGRLS